MWGKALGHSKCESLSCVQLFVIRGTVACHTHVSLRFSRQEYWSELLFSSLGHLPDPEIEPRYPALQADSLLSEPPGKPFVYDLNQIPSDYIVEVTNKFTGLDLVDRVPEVYG